MSKKKLLEEMVALTKSLQEEVKTLKTIGKEQSDKSEKLISDTLAKREQVIKDELIAKFRKGEHLAPHSEEEENAAVPEVLLRKSSDPRMREMMEYNDDVYLISKILRCHPSQTKIWRKNEAKVSELRKALNVGTAAQGLEWAPTAFSADLIDKYRLQLKVAALFQRVNMPTNPFTLPNLTADSTVYVVPEVTTDTHQNSDRVTASQPTTGSLTMTAKKLGARSLFSGELDEDSIIPVLPMLKDNLARKMADAWEDAIINGDTTVPGHMDIDITATTVVRAFCNGLRRRAKTSNVLKDLSTFNLANVRSLRTSMGKYGVNPAELVFITGPKGYNKLLGLDEVTTLEKYGAGATILAGELGRLDGIPIIISEHVREDLSTTGYYDSTTTNNTVLILANKTAFAIGDRRKVTLKTFEDIETDQTVLVTMMRGTFRDLYTAAGDVVANVGRDVDAA